MSVLILGDGLLGSELVKQTGWDCISRRLNKFDITLPAESYKDFGLHKHKTIVNCIAYTDTYSDDKETHWSVNYAGVVKLTNFCATNNIKLVHISTDYVYTNSVRDVSEKDVPIHGNNWYSYTKLLGDAYAQLYPQNLVLRGTHKPKPFPYLHAWINQVGNFDYVDVIASMYVKLIDKGAVGVYNVGTKIKTMHGLALQTKPTVAPTEVNTANVPGSLTMDLQKLNNLKDENIL